MESEQDPPHVSADRAAFIRRAWEKIATALAVISLADLSNQLIKWAALIHLVIEYYSAAKQAVFAMLPFHIPIRWHDFIVLGAIFLSIANRGLSRLRGMSLLGYIRVTFKAIVNPFDLWTERMRRREAASLPEFAPVPVPPEEFPDLLEMPVLALILLSYFFSLVIAVFYSSYYILTLFHNTNQPILTVISTALLAFIKVIGILILLIIFGGWIPIIAICCWAFVLFPFLAAVIITWRWLRATAAIFLALVLINEIYIRWLEPLSTSAA